MGNVLLCYQQIRRVSILDETTVTVQIESGSSADESEVPSDESAVPRMSFVPFRGEQKSATLDISQFPSGDMANFIIQSDICAFYACEGNIFNNSNKTLASFTPLSTRSPQGLCTWRDTETFTQHEKWLRTVSPSLILPTLFLGTKKDSLKDERLKELQITHILSLMGGKQHLIPGCKHLHVPMADSGNTSLDQVMNRSFGFIRESQQDGNKILIHCQQGQNRSPTVVIAWLMTESLIKGTPMSMYDAYLFVKERRHIVHPSHLYIQQLREFDKQLFGVYSVKPNFLSVSYEDGELKVQHENWTADQSDKYKELQKTESSKSIKSHIESKGVSLDTPRSVKTSKKKGTYGKSLMLPVTPKQDAGIGIVNIYRKPEKSLEIERFSEDHSVISLEGKKE